MNADPAPREVRLDPDKLAGLFDRWNRSDEPGLAVGIAHPTAGAWRRGFGLASVELPFANTPRTRLRIGSTSKMFTCLAVMLLQEDGRLSIDDPLRRYVPELPDWAEGMTLRHMMTHTSGMRCHIDLLYQTGNYSRPMPAETALECLVRQGGINFPVGTAWSYNNGGYALLTAVVERLTGEDFGAFLERRIFRPVGMTDTVVKRSDAEMLSSSASLHVAMPGGGFERGFFGIPIAGEGAMVSTVEDMLLWLQHMHRPFVGSPGTWGAMRTPMRLDNGRSTQYGLGLMTTVHRGLTVLHHAGGVMGGVSMCLTVPELALDVIILANRSDPPVQILGFDVLDACVSGLDDLPGGTGGGLAPGRYWSEEIAAPLELADADGKPTAKLWGIEMPMRGDGPGRIVSTLPSGDLTITASEDEPDRLAVDQRGSTCRFRQVEADADDPLAEAAKHEGRYRCEDVEATAIVSVSESAVTLRMVGPYGRDDFSLTRFSPGKWLSSLGDTGYGGVLEFDERGFRLTTARTRRLNFVQR